MAMANCFGCGKELDSKADCFDIDWVTISEGYIRLYCSRECRLKKREILEIEN